MSVLGAVLGELDHLDGDVLGAVQAAVAQAVSKKGGGALAHRLVADAEAQVRRKPLAVIDVQVAAADAAAFDAHADLAGPRVFGLCLAGDDAPDHFWSKKRIMSFDSYIQRSSASKDFSWARILRHGT